MGYSFVFGLLVAISLVSVASCFITVRLKNIGSAKTIQTPNFPSNVPPNTTIAWQLIAPEDHKIVMTCDVIRLLKRNNCTEGSFTVWDGESEHTMCNLFSDYHIESKKNGMKVQFSVGALGVGQMRCGAKNVERDDLGLSYFPEEDSSKLDHVSKKTTCDCGWTNRERIVGGTETGTNEYPFMVTIFSINKKKRFCGGSIITKYHVLTAAHCLVEANDTLGVIVGKHDFSKRNETDVIDSIAVLKTYLHEKYDHKNYTNDIALLVLDRKIEVNKKVGPICMPSKRYDLLNHHVKVLGFGLTADEGDFANTLQQVDLTVIDLKNCANNYTKYIPLEEPKQICTYEEKKDSCGGDSGGPVIHHDSETNFYVQVGLVSYGKHCASETPVINTDVYAYIDWIKTKVKKHKRSGNVCEMIH